MTSREDTQDRLVIRRLIPAPREDVFAAWTDPESIKHWMCPGDIVTAEAQLDLRVGGSFRIVMKGRDREVEHTGVYRVIEAAVQARVHLGVQAYQLSAVAGDRRAVRSVGSVRARPHARTSPGDRGGGGAPERVDTDRGAIGRASWEEGARAPRSTKEGAPRKVKRRRPLHLGRILAGVHGDVQQRRLPGLEGRGKRP